MLEANAGTCGDVFEPWRGFRMSRSLSEQLACGERCKHTQDKRPPIDLRRHQDQFSLRTGGGVSRVRSAYFFARPVSPRREYICPSKLKICRSRMTCAG